MCILLFKLKSGFSYELVLAEKLFSLGARTPLVVSLCHLSKKTAIRLYKATQQRSPKQGMLPYDQTWIIRSSVNNLHASIFLGIFQDLTNLQTDDDHDARLFITAYELYCQVVANNPRPSKLEKSVTQFILLDINRAWELNHQFNSNLLNLVICKKCQARFLRLNTLKDPFEQCPICEVWADRIGRRRWSSAKAKQIA